METEGKLRLTDVFVSTTDPRQAGKVEHDLVELLVAAVNAVHLRGPSVAGPARLYRLWAKTRLLPSTATPTVVQAEWMLRPCICSAPLRQGQEWCWGNGRRPKKNQTRRLPFRSC